MCRCAETRIPESACQELLPKSSAGGAAPAEQGRGLDLVEGPVNGDVAPRLVDPVGRIGRARKAHGLGKRLVDVAGRQPLQSAVVARVGIDRRTAGAVDLDQRAELAA